MSEKGILQTAARIMLLQQETSIERLEALLTERDEDLILPILGRLNELFDGQNVELLLSLALAFFHTGADPEAFACVEKAKLLAPYNHNVLRVGLFFACATGALDALEMSMELLSLYPNDKWAVAMRQKIHAHRLDSIDLPALDTKWERIIH
jgi:hypothetical protein